MPSPDDLVDMTGKLCDAARNGDVVKLRELLDAGAEVCRGDYLDNQIPGVHAIGAAEGHLAAVKIPRSRKGDRQSDGVPPRRGGRSSRCRQVFGGLVNAVDAASRHSETRRRRRTPRRSRSVWKLPRCRADVASMAWTP